MPARDRRRISVLIAGGGPVGLALAAELGWRGIACELVEQGDGAIVTPKMNEVNLRTMEFCRRWGIAEQVLNCPFPGDYPMDIVFVTSLGGHELGRMKRPPKNAQAPGPFSPVSLQICSQAWFDPILQKFAHSFPSVTLRYGCRLDSFEDRESGVVADLVDAATGTREQVEADYLVACDGATSGVRRALGIGLNGPGVLGHPVHLFFRAPGLLECCGKADGVFFLALDREGVWANIRVIDPVNAMWRLMVIDTDGTWTPETVDREAILRRALGFDHQVEWLGVSTWTRRGVVAERYVMGRVFLAGDAAHQLSPTGALGMNTGIGDAVDLGWKLAATVQGWGGPHLLESYDRERRPIGDRNVGMTSEFHHEHEGFEGLAEIDAATPDGAALRSEVGQDLVRAVGRMFRTAGLQIGYRYEGSPICVADGTPALPDDPETYTPSARPGARAPHLWLGQDNSMLDLYGRDFTLLRLGPTAPATGPIEAAANEQRLPLRTVTIDDRAACELYERSLVLVRPDGHVAWRGNDLPADPASLVARVRGA